MALSVETCVDEKIFYEKLELLKENSKSKITVYIDQLFYDNARNYLGSAEGVQEGERHGTEAQLSKQDINTIKRKGCSGSLRLGNLFVKDPQQRFQGTSILC